MEIKLPETEGVCELAISAFNASLRERLAWKKPLAERTVQLIVVGDKAAARPGGRDSDVDPGGRD